MPPQHGKSQLTSRFFQAWYIGRHPDHQILLGSYEAELAAYWGRKTRDIIKEYGPTLFDIKLNPKKQASNDWEIQDYEGGMRTAGSDGAFTGKKGDCVTIDDPHKNRKEAKSRVIQENIYDFYTDAADTRLSKIGIFPFIQTRWDILDLGGRILKAEEHITAEEALKIIGRNDLVDPDTWVVIKFPAIAKEHDILGRKPGEALCEDLHPIRDLLAKKKRTPHKRWISLYDQEPQSEGGDFFEEEWFKIRDIPPTDDHFIKMIRWWDMAKSEAKQHKKSEGRARTAGVLLALTDNHEVWTLDSRVYQLKPGKLRKKIRSVAERDHYRYSGRVKQRMGLDPGQASGDQELTYTRLLRGYHYRMFKESGSKEDRADDVAAWAEVNGLYIYKSNYDFEDYIQEHVDFPGGEFADQVDATSGALSQLFHGTDAEKYGSSEKNFTGTNKTSFKPRTRGFRR